MAGRVEDKKRDVFFWMRVKITAVSVGLILAVLGITFAAIGINEYNAKLRYVSMQLDDTLVSVAEQLPVIRSQLHVDSPSAMESGNDVSTPPGFDVGNLNVEMGESEVGGDRTGNVFGNVSIVPRIGVNSDFMQAFVPIIVYRIDDDQHSLVAVDEQMAHLTEESLEEANETIVDAPYGFARDDKSNIYYLKKKTDYGDLVAFTDISVVNYYIGSLTQAFIIVAVIVVLALGTSAWVVSGMIVRPASESWDRQRQFVADVSHELKTPISVIAANSALVLEAKDTSDTARKWTEVTLSEAENMKSLVEDMLYLTANSVKKDVIVDEIDLSKEVRRAAMQFEARAFEKGNTIDYSAVEKGILIDGESAGIRRLLGILIDNACKYSYKDTPVQIELSRDGKDAVLKVSDIGDTIPAGMEREVFERFVRTDKARTRMGGYGLGLAMAKDIVEGHGGSISAQTAKDGQTVFTAVLPCKAKGKG